MNSSSIPPDAVRTPENGEGVVENPDQTLPRVGLASTEACIVLRDYFAVDAAISRMGCEVYNLLYALLLQLK
jgi:hypothetical protein